MTWKPEATSRSWFSGLRQKKRAKTPRGRADS